MKTKVKVTMNPIHESFTTKSHKAKPVGIKAGKALKTGAVFAVATLAAGIGAIAGTASGFVKGLWS